MPKIPSRVSGRRIAVRYAIRAVDDYYWARAYDQAGRRYPSADVKDKCRETVARIARERVNDSYSSEELDETC